MSSGRAIVDSLEVRTLESFPVQVQVVARGNLPDACTELDKVETRREGHGFRVTLLTKRPADALCAAVLTPFEKVIPLEVSGLKKGRYTVSANDAQTTFELQADN